MTVPDKLRDVLEPTIEAMGYDVVEVEYQPRRGDRTLRVYIDKSQGITLEDCEQVSHQINGLLDVEDVIPGAYTLEVSSPGLDRLLTKERDFERFAGERAKIKLKSPLDGRRRFTGMLAGFSEKRVMLEIDGKQYALPFEQISKARLVPQV